MSVLHISNLVFTALNVLLILYLFWYLVTRYLIPGLRSGLKAHEQQLINEQQAYDKTLLEYESIKRQRSLYDVQAHQLMTLLDRWHKTIEQEKQQAVKEQQERTKNIHDYLHTRQEYRHLKQTQDYVFERAYEQARNKLQEKYALPSTGKEQIHAIIESLKGKSHG